MPQHSSPGAPPDLRRADATTVHVATRHVPDPETGHREAAEAAEQWQAAVWPDGLLSVSVYLSTDGATLLSYTQSSGPDGYPQLAAPLKGFAGAPAVAYAPPHRTVQLNSTATPAAFVVAVFDTDGPDAQREVAAAVGDAVRDAPAARHPGLISANFHLSADGSRVLNYAEWTTDAAHEEFLAGATRAATLRATHSTPGVRPIGFTRYHLLHTLHAQHAA